VEIMECSGTGWIGAFGEHEILRTLAEVVEGCARDISRVSSVCDVFPRVTGEKPLSETAYSSLGNSVCFILLLPARNRPKKRCQGDRLALAGLRRVRGRLKLHCE
jgi:hypothetical protein